MDAMTARLIGRTGKAEGTDAAVSDLLVIGSAAGNELRIDSRTLSRRHAQIVRSGTEYYVEDLGSRNGTFLNGQRVKRFPIRNLDVLSLGPDVDLIFVQSGTPAPMPAARRPPLARVSVTWIDGPLAGRTEDVPAGGLVLGRAGGLESLGAISRRHAVFTRRGDRVTVEDLGSANGTLVNGTAVTAVTPLSDGDEVSLGGIVRLRVSAASRVDEAPAEVPQDTILVPSGTIGAPALDVPRTMSHGPRTSPSSATPSAATPPSSATPAVPSPTVQAPPEPIVAPKKPTAPPPVPAAPPSEATPSSATPPDATLLAPREAAIAPKVAPRGKADPQTFRVTPEAAAAPSGLGARARAARRPEDATKLARQAPAPPPPADSQPAEPAIQPEPEPRGGETTGVVFDGPSRTALALGTFMIGRQTADVIVDSPDVSRQHARLFVTASGIELEDLKTANGTFVNDTRITTRTRLPDGCRVRFATVEFTVIYQRSSGEQTP